MRILAVFVLLIPALCAAQQPCVDIEESAQRLACYDKANNRPDAPPKAKAADPKVTLPNWLKSLQVRDEGLPATLPVAGPAFFGYTKNDRKDSSLIKASVIYTGPALTTGGAGTAPFGSFSIHRDLTAATPRNSVAGKLGLRTTVFDYADTGFAIDATASIGTRQDRIKNTRTDNVLLTGRLVTAKLASGESFGTDGVPFQLVPIAGAGLDRLLRAPIGVTTGQSRYVFGGATLSVWPAIVSKQVQITGRYQRLVDTNTSAGIDKRRTSYRDIAFDYYLFDPRDEKAIFQPIISISRELGTDPIKALSGINRTTIGLKFKIN